jgi:hypothetical protein
MHRNLSYAAFAIGAVMAGAFVAPTGAMAQDTKISFGMPGVPPAFVSVL